MPRVWLCQNGPFKPPNFQMGHFFLYVIVLSFQMTHLKGEINGPSMKMRHQIDTALCGMLIQKRTRHVTTIPSHFGNGS